MTRIDHDLEFKFSSVTKGRQPHDLRHFKLRKTIGNASNAEKKAEFSSLEKFANAKELNRGIY